MYDVMMPQWGMDMTEGTILKWLVKEGDRVEKGTPLAEIEIAKATNELESPVAGVVAKLVVEEEETVHIRGLLAIIDDAEG